MDIITNFGENDGKPFVSLEKHEIIHFETEGVSKDYFMVYSKDIDDSIPAVLLQLWKFVGGYDHAVVNVVHMDLKINNRVEIVKPTIIPARVVSISSYRSETKNRHPKEEYILNMDPQSTSDEPDEDHPIPWMCKLELHGKEGLYELNLPQWTPLQKLPLDRIKVDTVVEVWDIGVAMGIMKVLKL